MGVRFSKKEDAEIYSDVTKELKLMGPHLKKQTLTKSVAERREKYETAKTPKSPPRIAHKPTEAPNKGLITKILDKVTGEAGFCIRCGTGLPKFDLQKPYCDKCYASWARYKNPKYKEKFCHACGRDDTKNTITFEKPTCKGCFTEYYK